MDTMPPLFVSPMLREAAGLKIDELSQAKNDVKRLYSQRAGGQPCGVDPRASLKELLDIVIKLDPSFAENDDFEIVRRYVKHPDERLIAQPKLFKIQQDLLSKLHKHFCRLECSSVHVDLMKESMVSCDTMASAATKLASVDLDDDFEVVETNELNGILESFEKEAFAKDNVDVDAIEAFLTTLTTEIGGPGALFSLREDLKEFGDEAIAGDMDIGQDFLMWCVADLLKKKDISEDKKRTLSEYLQSPIALKELASIIQAKSIRHWKYKNAEKGLPAIVRQDADGKPRVVIEEGVVDMLFLHCLGIGFSMKLKSCLDRFAGFAQCFQIPYLTVEQTNKREFFLGRHPMKMTPPPPSANVCSMCHPYMQPNPFPAAPMPPPPPPPITAMDPPPPPPVVEIINTISSRRKPKVKSRWNHRYLIGVDGLDHTRNQNYIRDFLLSRLPDEDGCSPSITPAEDVQAKLIKTLVVEKELRKAFDGEVSMGSVKFNSLSSSLPHKTILAILKFLELPEDCISLFERFLSAKLNIGPAVRGAADRVLPRTRGVPDDHALELFFTEAIMCFFELSVRQTTGAYLYRLKDRCYFIGNNEQYLAFEEQGAKFADVMGLDIDFERDQQIGLLTLSNDGISISGLEVHAYAHSVKKQLAACTTIFDWVRVWNSSIGTYAAHLFGPLSNIMGKTHLQSVTDTYRTMFSIILDNRDLTTHITSLLSKHVKLGPSIAVEPLIYLPQAYGGLGVKNPFITLALAHEMPEDPTAGIKSFLQSEEAYYSTAATNYALLDAEGRARKLESIFENDQTRIDAAMGPGRDLSVFMSKDELVALRERAPYAVLPIPPYPARYSPVAVPSLANLYDDLVHEPRDPVSCSEKIRDEVRRLSGKNDMQTFRRLSGEDKWVLQLYGDECFEKYGGLEMWCGESVPQEVLRVVRGGAWDEEDDEDSDSCVSDLSEP